MNTKKTRRSSILKTSKLTTNNDSDSEDDGAEKSVRRVSFARVNAVKPFVVHDEINTIWNWDSTIEEDANHTDSTQESQDRLIKTQTQTTINITNYDIKDMSQTVSNIPEFLKESDDKENIRILPSQTQIAINVTNYDAKDMSQTISDIPEFLKAGVNKENMPILPKKLSLVDYAKRSDAFKSFENSRISKNFDEIDLTIPEVVPNSSKHSRNEESRQSVSIKKTSILSSSMSQSVKFNRDETDDNMELTCQVPTHNQLITLNRSVRENTRYLSDDMEFTCQVPNINCQKTDTPPLNDMMELTRNNSQLFATDNTKTTLRNLLRDEVKDVTQLSLVGMEFTCQMPKMQDVPDNLMMEMTCNNSQSVSKPTNKSLHHSANDNTQLSIVGMELTCQIPDVSHNVSHLLSKSQLTQTRQNVTKRSLDAMEFTCQIPDVPEKDVMTLPDKSPQNQTTNDRTQHPLMGMEFTCQIPNIEAVSENDTMEMTCNTSQISVNPRGTENSFDDGMEFTCQIPNITYQMSGNNISDNVMELTCDSPQIVSKSQIPLQQTINDNSKYLFVDPEITHPKPNGNCQMSEVTNEIHKEQCQKQKINDISKAPMTNTSYTTIELPKDLKTVLNDVTSHVTSDIDSKFLCQDSKILDTTPEPCNYTAALINSNLKDQTPHKNIDYNKKNSVLEPMEVSLIEKSLLRNSNVDFPIVNTPQKVLVKTFERSPSLIHLHSLPKPKIRFNKTDIGDSLFVSPNMRLSFSEKENFTGQIAQLNFTNSGSGVENIGSGVDDTQHLIHCAFTNSGLDDHTIPEVDITGTNDTNLEIIKSNCKLTNVNDTYALRSACASNDGDSTANSSLNIIKNLSDCEDISTYYEAKLPVLKDFKFKVKSRDLTNTLNIKTNTRRARIKEFYEKFEYEPIIVPNIETILEEQCDSDSFNVSEETNNAITELTLEEKIKEKQASLRGQWRLESIEDNIYKFSTLYQTLDLIAEIDPSTNKVVDLTIENHLSPTCLPLAFYIEKLFLDSLKEGQIKSAIGRNYDILTLLDYIHITMEKIHNLQNELRWHEHLTIHEHFIAKYKINRLFLRGEVWVNVGDLENVDLAEEVQIVEKVGEIKKEQIQQLIRNCRKGFVFFKDFCRKMEEFVESTIKREKNKIC